MSDEPRQGATRIIDSPGQASILVVQECALTVTAGPDKGKSHPLKSGRVSVGTDLDNGLVLSDPTVSARHFELRLDELGPLLRDMGSTNGTWVDGFRVEGLYLVDGNRIRAGETVFEFALEKGEFEVPLSSSTNFGGLLGQAPAMRAAFAVLERVGPTDTTVLIEGESGTGKELAAEGLHASSPRREGPFVLLDCGAVPSELAEGELFGACKGAFTGAVEAREGAFERAHGGTIVLDEVGELPLELQSKLLRAVETKTIQTVGGNERRQVDVRVVACTNRNLEEEVAQGRFRKDLFFRLGVILVRLPPLRDRMEEVPRLAQHFFSQLGGSPLEEVPRQLMTVLLNHTWPGNVRELRNVIQRLVVLPELEPVDYLGQSHVPERRQESAVQLDKPFHVSKREWTERFEKTYLAGLLSLHKRNISEVARACGLSRQSCYRLMHKYGLDVA